MLHFEIILDRGRIREVGGVLLREVSDKTIVTEALKRRAISEILFAPFVKRWDLVRQHHADTPRRITLLLLRQVLQAKRWDLLPQASTPPTCHRRQQLPIHLPTPTSQQHSFTRAKAGKKHSRSALHAREGVIHLPTQSLGRSGVNPTWFLKHSPVDAEPPEPASSVMVCTQSIMRKFKMF